MKRIFEGFIILSVVLLFSTTAQAKKVAGIDVPETILVHKEVLQLNGAGIREKYLLDIYVGALYLPTKSSDAAEILESKVTKSITMLVLQNLSKGTLANSMENGIVRNVSDAEFEVLQDDIKAFSALYTDVDKKGLITIHFLADGDTELFINYRKKGSVKGYAFQRAFLSAWLGKSPATENIKKAMLGDD